ncbi:zinc-binding metallopeptidase family protein [Pleomorphovibrio marinus]|uniref:zinc-binding metallopeptidase family protein n=1 Tax=Pleomorphovibrio marinus TaxID=2164132 RepID=UPI000E0C5C0C|nr:putative zinc-binding peptidase [Pleomorphovibrio marinus]
MQLFNCDHCGHPVYFDNVRCDNCGHSLGFDPERMLMLSLVAEEGGKWRSPASGKLFKYCANQTHDVCNWLIPMEKDSQYCMACELNRVIPNLTNPIYADRWRKIEQAKHRLVYALLKWGLPITGKFKDTDSGLIFDFKADDHLPEGERILTGHAMGVITLNIAEADDVEREMAKKQMDEVYRTVLGHFRHEVGHYYWEQLVLDSPWIDGFHLLFGDERQSYQACLDYYYRNGPQKDWGNSFISPYATMHPWEDWAETWAHYMHIVDTLETAYSFGLQVQPRRKKQGDWLSTHVEENAYTCKDFQTIISMWMPLSIAMNSMNRSMGARDLYPFVLSAPVVEKLSFIHRVIHGVKDLQ